jgi:hypothetical protein
MPFPLPGRDLVIPAATTDDDQVGNCVDMLRATYRVQGTEVRASVIMGAAEEIALVLCALDERGIDASQLGIEQIYTAYAFVDDGLRQFLINGFGARLIERFSLSEIFGGATLRADLDAFVLDPYVVGEIVDEDGRPVAAGEAGELVMTELYPLVQMQPLIRYRTGDVVQRVEGGADLALRWWGRRHECVSVGAGEAHRWLLGSRHVSNALAGEPGAARHAVREQLRSVHAHHLGPIDYELNGPQFDSTAFSITIRVTQPPLLYPQASSAMVARLWDALARACAGTGLSACVRLEHGGSIHVLPTCPLTSCPPVVR